MTPCSPFDRCFCDFGRSDCRQPSAMEASRFDRVSSLLLSLLLALMVWTGALGLIWLLRERARPLARPLHPVVGSGSPTTAVADPAFEIPDSSEITDLVSPDLASLIDGLHRASQQVAMQGEPDVGLGQTDGRTAGPGPADDQSGQGVRWELTFIAASQHEYARQLDFYGIQLGAFGGGHVGLDYASSLASGPVRTNLADASGEGRLYFSWLRANPLAEYERRLLEDAGIVTFGRQIVKFIPHQLENQLSLLELEYAHSNGFSSAKAIARTVFRSEPSGDGYRFTVASQRYKRGVSSVVIGDPKN